MKKLLAVCCLAALTFGAANAQVSYGTKAGADFSKWTISVQGAGLNISTTFNKGFYLGGSAVLPLTDAISLQGDLLYSYSGATISAGKKLLEADIIGADNPVGTDRIAININNSSIYVPIVAKYSFDNFSLMAGPYISYRFASSIKANGNLEDFLKEQFAALAEEEDLEYSYSDLEDAFGDVINDNLKKVEFGLNFGAEYAFEGGLFIEARYAFSIGNMLKYDSIDLSSLNEIAGDPNHPMPTDIDLSEIAFMKGLVPTIKTQSFKIGLGYRF